MSQGVARICIKAYLTLVPLCVLGSPALGQPSANIAAGSTAAVVESGVKPSGASVTPLTSGLRFSDPPTDEELLRAGLFAQPLVPVGSTTREENSELAALLVAYNAATRHGDRDAVQPLVGFLANHPHSAWKPALQVNLGAVYRRTGHFSKALETWRAAWEGSKGFTDPRGRAMGDAAVAYLSKFEAYLGRKEALGLLLQEVKTRPIHGSAAELISESSQGLADMLTRPDVAFKCGPSALASILALQPSPTSAQSRRVLELARSTPNGLSLSAVQAISVEAGMGYQMAFRSSGAPIIVPAVAHWKVGHYAALLGKDISDRLLIGDATFGEDIVISRTTLDEEASGYFLVAPGALPEGWRSVDAAEGSAVWGSGDTGSSHDNGATGSQEIHAFPCGPDGGCSNWNVEAMVDGLSMHDDPIGYTPPVGPPIRFPMEYSHRDAQQPQIFSYTNFGNKWTTGWLSYVEATAGCEGDLGSTPIGMTVPGGAVIGPGPNVNCNLLYRRGGGSETYVFWPWTSAQWSGLGQFSGAILTRYGVSNVAATGFSRALPDGSVEKFEQQMGRFFFMTEVDDPQGNAVKITYDGQMRIVAIADAIGQVTTLCYNDSWQTQQNLCSQPPSTSNPPSNLQVTQVTDPFGRSAYFGYDPGTGHLTSITDVVGITSSFTYDNDSDFINTLTTPYGTTKFAFTDSSNDPTAGSTRSVTITDPLSRVSRVEFHQGGMYCYAVNNATAFGQTSGFAQISDPQHIACSETSVPSGMAVYNGWLQYRNTFIWDPYQYSLCSNPDNSCYSQATIIHWLHTNVSQATDTNPLTASRIPESFKKPLESRVWFDYVNQNLNAWSGAIGGQIGVSSVGVGSTNQPTAIGRVLDDGTTQLFQYQYNPYGKLTQSTDPVGRQLTMTYDTNGIDLLTVSNTTHGRNDLLLTLSDYNGQHEPQRVTATNGQVTSLSYNAAGQLVTVTNPLNHTWSYAYAPSKGGYLQQITGPAGPQVPTYNFSYDNAGRLFTVTDPGGETLTYYYDAANRLTKTLFPDQTYVLLGYTLLDLTSVNNRRGYQTIRRYNADRELVGLDEPAGRTTVLSYGPNGALNTIQDPRQFVTNLAADLEARVQTITYPDGTQKWYSYDNEGRVVFAGPTNSPNNPNAPGRVLYSYNADDTISQVSSVSSPGGIGSPSPTLFAYDPAYRRLTRWSLSAAAATAWAAESEETFTYNPVTSPPTLGANRLYKDITAEKDMTYPGSLSPVTESTYTYDALDRVVGHTLTPRVTPTVSATVEPAPFQVTESWGYDPLGRVVSQNNALDDFAYTYGDATRRVYGRVSFGGPQVAASYYPPTGDNLLQQLTYTTTVRNPFPEPFPTPVQHVPLAQYAYQYDPNHNVTSFTETYPNASAGTSTTYTLDAYDQLTLGNTPGIGSTTYGYDLSGNANSETAIVVSPPSLSNIATGYDSSNKITSINEGNSQRAANYDANGNLGSIGTWPGPQYFYDGLNRLVQVTNGDDVTSLIYDGIGRVVQIVEQTAVVITNRSYAWCGALRCVEFDNMRQVSASSANPAATTAGVNKIYLPQGMLAYAPPTSNPAHLGGTPARMVKAYDVTDLLGSERELFAENAVLARYEYDPYGSQSIDGTRAGDRGFAGYFKLAATGLDLTRNRVYSPAIGRWLTRDPIGNGLAFVSRASNSTDINLYAYAGDNPTSRTDPSGLCPPRPFGGPDPKNKMLREYFGSSAPWLVKNFSLFNVLTLGYWETAAEALFVKQGLFRSLPGGTINWILDAPLSGTFADFYIVTYLPAVAGAATFAADTTAVAGVGFTAVATTMDLLSRTNPEPSDDPMFYRYAAY